ncbi:MAG: hypothetical protein LC791_13195 [Acidobacteria bacterium]|nr:hypothetical protein [Acidobacteriota bacterium]
MSGYFPGTYFSSRYFSARYFGVRGLMVDLDGEAVRAFDQSIPAIELAEKVLSYWDAQPL